MQSKILPWCCQFSSGHFWHVQKRYGWRTERSAAVLHGHHCKMLDQDKWTFDWLPKIFREHILGEILKVWGRAEFQSAAVNLQHCLILFWLNNHDEEDLNKISCAHKHVFAEFERLFNVNFSTEDSIEHADKLFDDCVRVQTHDCEKGHCLKKAGLNGERKCRFHVNHRALVQGIPSAAYTGVRSSTGNWCRWTFA